MEQRRREVTRLTEAQKMSDYRTDFNAFMRRVRRAAERIGIGTVHPCELAIALAMAHQESATSHNAPSDLALTHRNLFGIKYIGADAEREWYYPVQYERRNSYDPKDAPPPVYRGYESLEHCLANWRWHMTDSDLYAPARQACAGVPINSLRHWEILCEQAAAIWCDENPMHAKGVMVLYGHYCRELGVG